MIFYVTYNDLPSGIFSSQVIDVVKFLNTELNTQTKLVSFISLRGFFSNRKKIKQNCKSALVVPMFPGIHRWKLNWLTLYVITFINKPTAIIGRSVLATQLALRVKNKRRTNFVVYDGRGAIAAEWKEYKVVTHSQMLDEIDSMEKEVVLNADYRIAVSEQLVNYWNLHYDYESTNHVVIPCTLNHIFEKVVINDDVCFNYRNKLGYNKDDKVFIYSGSVAGWQSLDLLNKFLENLLMMSDKNKILFLSDADEHILYLKSKFSGQVVNIKVSQNQVSNYLLAGDYGILIREQSDTNKVASPVKFAEYLACGLGVVISDNLGDYSSFVTSHSCGMLYQNFSMHKYDKVELNKLAMRFYTKNTFIKNYQKVVSFLKHE